MHFSIFQFYFSVFFYLHSQSLCIFVKFYFYFSHHLLFFFSTKYSTFCPFWISSNQCKSRSNKVQNMNLSMYLGRGECILCNEIINFVAGNDDIDMHNKKKMAIAWTYACSFIPLNTHTKCNANKFKYEMLWTQWLVYSSCVLTAALSQCF